MPESKRSKVIAVLSPKGGVGKTTLTANLAVLALKDFKHVAAIDLDPQLGLAHWSELRGHEQPHITPADGDLVETVELLIEDGNQLILIDGVPGSLELTEEAIDVADLVVIPMLSSEQDVHAARYAVTLCKRLDTSYLIVVNVANAPKDVRADELRAALTQLKQPVAETIVRRRTIIVDAMNDGQAVCQLTTKRAVPAQLDFASLYAEIMANV